MVSDGPWTGKWHQLFDVETKHPVLVGASFWALCEVAFHWHPAARAKGATKGGFNPDVDDQPVHLLRSDSVRHEAHRDGDGLWSYSQQPTESRPAFKSQWPVLVPVWPVTDPITALWGCLIGPRWCDLSCTRISITIPNPPVSSPNHHLSIVPVIIVQVPKQTYFLYIIFNSQNQSLCWVLGSSMFFLCQVSEPEMMLAWEVRFY